MTTIMLAASPSRRLLRPLFVEYAPLSSSFAARRRGYRSQADEFSPKGRIDQVSCRRQDRAPRTLQRQPSLASTRRGRRHVSDWSGMRGHDLLADQQQPQHPLHAALPYYDPPKIVLHGYGPTGFDVGNALKNVQAATEDDSGNTSNNSTAPINPKDGAGDGTLHMNGSILAFPKACFLWNVRDVRGITLPALSSVLLHQKPSRIEYLFLGINPSQSSDNGVDFRIHPNLHKIQSVMYKQHNIVVEVMDLLNAIGTFNVLNAEDRMVATALLLDPTETDDDEAE